MPLPEFGFPAQPRQYLLSRLTSGLRDRGDTARQEAVTGRHADPAAALQGRVAEMLQIEQQIGQIGQYREIIGMAQSRAETIQSSLEALRGLAIDMHVDGQRGLSSGLAVASESTSVAARQALWAAVSALNVSFGGRSLFAGDTGGPAALASSDQIMAAVTTILEAGPTAGQAYANLQNAFDDPGGVFATTLYAGGDGDVPATEIAEGERLSFAPRADAQPIRTLLRDLATLAAAFDTDNAIPEAERRGLAERAVTGLRDIVNEIAGMAGRLGAAEQRMAEVLERHGASESALTLAYNRIAGRDQYDAAAELNLIDSQLETSYIATARMSRLTLASFLG